MVEEQKKSGKTLERIKVFTIENELGLHLRPAGLFAKTANKFSADITVEKGGAEADGKSIISITTLNVVKNSTIRVKARGKDADKALKALERLIASNFNEKIKHGYKKKRCSS